MYIHRYVYTVYVTDLPGYDLILWPYAGCVVGVTFVLPLMSMWHATVTAPRGRQPEILTSVGTRFRLELIYAKIIQARQMKFEIEYI